ncbi:hypothetical protein FA13DRAFT_1741785 [Coprinellus micaceus]|uniref:Uncharacterized protein n=1 Tax=Coprinellus micaceus TaxID=71717 RepID=A0A4Y7SIY4_COPMI|nr:hypothetical protein FA13DRAFT_1741785 [Coprinellus micaceus]
MSAAQLLSPPNSPRDHRLFVPRRPSPLSLPPMAPHLSLDASSTTTSSRSEQPKTGSKMPRYPLEKQRRAGRVSRCQRQAPMNIPSIASGSGSGQAPVQDMVPSPTTTLPLTPRSAASTISSLYRPRGNPASSMCAMLFGSCFAAFAVSSRRLETINMRSISGAR